MAGPMKTSLSVDVTEATKGVQQASDLVEGGATRMRVALINAGKGFEELGSKAAKYKKEQVAEGRLVGFYVKELAEFTNMSGKAQAAVGGMAQAVGAFLSGGLVGGLYEAAKVAVGLIRDTSSSARDEMSLLSQEIDQLLAKSRAAKASAGSAWLNEQINGQGARGKGYREAKAALEQAKAEQKELNQQIADARSGASSGSVNPNSVSGSAEMLELKLAQAVAAEEKARTKLQEAWRTLAGGSDAIDRGMVNQGPEDFFKDDAKNREAARKAGEKAGAEYLKGLRKATAELDATLAKSFGDAENGVAAGSNSQASLFEGQRMAQRRAQEQAAAQSQKALQDRTAAYSTAIKKAKEDERAQLKSSMEAWQSYGEVAGQAMVDLASGTRTMGDVMKDVMKQIMAALYKYAVSAIMKNAGIAGSEAAAQNSKMGPWGWIAGIAAMGVIFSAVQALVGQIGSAESGAVLPSSGGPFPFQLHPNEWVLPADKAQGLDRLIKSGRGGGAGGNHYWTIQTMDARSFEDYLASNPSALRNAQARIARRG